MRLWDLPGPRRFVDSTCQFLLRGNNVVVRFGATVHDGFEDAVVAGVGNALGPSRLQATEAPLSDLAHRYSDDPNGIRRLADLCEDPGFRGCLVLPQGLDSNNWDDWRQFLEDYAQASRSRSLLGRSRFLVALAGPPATEPPPMEVGIENLAWNGVIEDLDLLLFANEQLRPRVDEPLLRSLLATAVAKVAAWDFDIAAALVAENNETIMDPCELLRANARERGWTTDTPIDQRIGTCLGGISHPMRAALDEPPTELHRRLWSAQLSVLLPWIEARRHEIIMDNLYDVKGLMHAVGDWQGDPFALELGDLAKLYNRRGADRRTRESVKRLHAARNRLAHGDRVAFPTVQTLIAET